MKTLLEMPERLFLMMKVSVAQLILRKRMTKKSKVDECPMQAFYEMKADECKAHNGNCKECNMGCDIEEDEEEE